MHYKVKVDGKIEHKALYNEYMSSSSLSNCQRVAIVRKTIHGKEETIFSPEKTYQSCEITFIYSTFIVLFPHTETHTAWTFDEI